MNLVVDRYSDIEAFFKTYLDLDNDRDMFNRLASFRMSWATKRIDSKYSNLDFLSGMTIGVQAVRFSPLDEYRLSNEVFRLDMESVQKDFYNVKDIVKEWKVSSNVIYQALLYMIRYVFKNNLPIEYVYECYYVMAYKILTSLMSHRFDVHDLDPRIASKVVEEMSGKFILKEKGSWQKYLEYRATFLLEGSLHYGRLMNNYDTKVAIDIVNDLQHNIRSTVNKINNLVRKVSDSDLKIDNDKLTRIENEEVVIADIKSYGKYAKIALERVTSSDFADDNLIYLITELSPNINHTTLKTVLINISDSSLEEFSELEWIVDTTLKTSMKYLLRSDGITNIEKDIFSIMKSLKAYYSSSTVRDADILELKKRVRELVERHTVTSTSWVLSSLTINLLIYIVLNGIIKR